MIIEKHKYTVSADIIGHLQHMSDLPEVGSTVLAVAKGVEVYGEVFAHVPHPTTNATGWGFALIKLDYV
tara:strand:+ start:366 stop:572 length:207 start_codon:yes stop_codon:yes gene_type:complete